MEVKKDWLSGVLKVLTEITDILFRNGLLLYLLYTKYFGFDSLFVEYIEF